MERKRLHCGLEAHTESGQCAAGRQVSGHVGGARGLRTRALEQRHDTPLDRLPVARRLLRQRVHVEDRSRPEERHAPAAVRYCHRRRRRPREPAMQKGRRLKRVAHWRLVCRPERAVRLLRLLFTNKYSETSITLIINKMLCSQVSNYDFQLENWKSAGYKITLWEYLFNL